MILLPGIYVCLTFWQTEKFNGISKFEMIVLAAAEIAFLRMWRADSTGEVPYILSLMKYVMLAFMTYFCVEDHKEQLVPEPCPAASPGIVSHSVRRMRDP